MIDIGRVPISIPANRYSKGDGSFGVFRPIAANLVIFDEIPDSVILDIIIIP